MKTILAFTTGLVLGALLLWASLGSPTVRLPFTEAAKLERRIRQCTTAMTIAGRASDGKYKVAKLISCEMEELLELFRVDSVNGGDHHESRYLEIFFTTTSNNGKHCYDSTIQAASKWREHAGVWYFNTNGIAFVNPEFEKKAQELLDGR